jgi:large subunit ribosomal protein L6
MLNTSKQKIQTEEVEIPDNINILIKDKVLTVTGPLGSIEKNFRKIPVGFNLDSGKVRFNVYLKGKKGLALAGTFKSLLQNLFRGVLKGYTYRMKIYYRHFPFSVSVSEKYVNIKNFGGERGLRRVPIIGDSKVEAHDDELLVKGLSKEDVGQTAALIHQACKIKTKDPRIFLDGIYVYSKQEGL